MQKIIDIKDKDFLKGISSQPYSTVGGLFQTLNGVDPFEQQGVALASLTPASIIPGTVPTVMTTWNNIGTSTVLVHTPTKLYRLLKDSPYTSTDITSEISVAAAVTNAIVWKSKYVYATDQLRATTLASSDVQLKSGFNSSTDFIALCVGADGNLYHGDNSRIGIITSATGTAGNAGTASIDDDFNVRDILNDGRYLVLLADNNAQATGSRLVGNYKCRIYFWDMVKYQSGGVYMLPDVVWDIKDSYLIGGKVTDNGIEFFGYNGLYTCNAATQPRLIRPMTGTNDLTKARPLKPTQIDFSKGSLYWVDGTANVLQNGVIHAYGNPITGQQKIFYRPYVDSTTTQTQKCLLVVGDQIWKADDAPKIYVHNIGSTRGTANLATIDITLDQPHTYGYTKVVLDKKLASGQSVQVVAYGAGLTSPITSETQSYSTSNPKQSLIFKRVPAGSTYVDKFEDISVQVNTVGAGIKRITTYGTPLEDSNADL